MINIPETTVESENPGSTPPDTGCLKRTSNWAVNTSTIYRIGMIRLGIAQTITGGASITAGGALMGLNANPAWAGIGVYAGLPAFATGLTCIGLRFRKPKSKLSPCSILCAISLVASVFLLISSLANICGVVIDVDKFYPTYKLEDQEIPLYIINSFLVLVGIVQAIFSSWALALSVGFVFWCCRRARDRIYTISYDDALEKTLVEAEFELATDTFFEAGERVLKIEPDMSNIIEFR